VDTNWDIIIVGGGPGGLAAAQYGARANLKTLLIEEMACGGASLLIDQLENYPGFAEAISGYDFGEALRKQAEKFGAVIHSASVTAIEPLASGRFSVKTSAENLEAGAVILASGAKHRHAGVKGEEDFAGRGVSYCATCDGPFFRGKPILVIGGGDAACDEASYLAKLSDKITMIHRREKFRAQPAVAERVIKNPNISVRWNTIPIEIRGDNKVRSALVENVLTHEREELAVEAVFVFVGSDPRTQLVPFAKKDETGYLVTDQCMQTSQPGLFAVGDVRATPFRQVVVAAGDGAIAAHCAAQYLEALPAR
jgi:thioredoxin reductase (NADPH)